jgi:hypothetical protein
MNEDRGPWYLLTGVVIGVVLGLVYAWRIDPVVYEKTAPSTLQEEYKAQYRALVAAAFAANGNLPRAQARLAQLGDEDTGRAVAIQAQRALAENRPEAEARALGLLAVALSQGSSASIQETRRAAAPSPAATATPTAVPATNTPAPSPTLPEPSASPANQATSALRTLNPTITPLPTRTPTPTRGAPFVLQDSRPICDAGLDRPLIVVEAQDASGNPVPGAEVIVQWEGNEDRFFTGLKPELGLGYADFEMTPGVTYALRLAEGGEQATDLAARECESSGGSRFWGSWRLVFVQP